MPRSERAASLGITIGRFGHGPRNAISDVRGVRVAAETLVAGDGELVRGRGPIRTGVTAILPQALDSMGHPLFAGTHRLNGNGEMTGLEWIRESGFLTTPICITNTHSVGVVHDEMIRWSLDNVRGAPAWSLPVVGETFDGVLNDINGFHITSAHARAALDAAAALPVGAPVPRGNQGGGTGMICHGFKGGNGTSSRTLPAELGGYTVGVFVQANHGRRHRLTIAGRVLGAEGGVLGVICGIIGNIQANEAIKLIIGKGKPLMSRLLRFDAMDMSFREYKIPKDPNCPLCGKNPTITKLIVDLEELSLLVHDPSTKPETKKEITQLWADHDKLQQKVERVLRWRH